MTDTDLNGVALAGLDPTKVLDTPTMDRPVAPTRPEFTGFGALAEKLGLDPMHNSEDLKIMNAYIDGKIELPTYSAPTQGEIGQNYGGQVPLFYKQYTELKKYRDSYDSYKEEMKNWKAGTEQRKQNFKEFEKLTGEDLISRKQLEKAHPDKKDPKYYTESGSFNEGAYNYDLAKYESLKNQFDEQFEKYGLDASYNVIDPNASYYQKKASDAMAGNIVIRYDMVDELLNEIDNELIKKVKNMIETEINNISTKVANVWEGESGQEMLNIITKKKNKTFDDMDQIQKTCTTFIMDAVNKIIESDKKNAQNME